MPDLVSCMEKLGYTFKDPSLLEIALTHTSAVTLGRADLESYERLEFLGDRVVGLVISDLLFRYYTRAVAGEMNRRLSMLVRRETLAEVASEIGINQFIVLSQGEKDTGGCQKMTILADVMEAILGALYFDGGYLFVYSFVEKHWKLRLEQNTAISLDPKSALQEWSQAQDMGLPEYRLVHQLGSDHEPEFIVSCRVREHEVQGRGSSKRAAQRNAARLWLNIYSTNEGI